MEGFEEGGWYLGNALFRCRENVKIPAESGLRPDSVQREGHARGLSRFAAVMADGQSGLADTDEGGARTMPATSDGVRAFRGDRSPSGLAPVRLVAGSQPTPC